MLPCNPKILVLKCVVVKLETSLSWNGRRRPWLRDREEKRREEKRREERA